MSAIGKPSDRPDGHAKVSGSAEYTGDVALQGLLYARLVESTVAAGRILHIDSARAEALPGVRLVLTHLNAERLPKDGQAGYGPPAGRKLSVLQDDAVHYDRQPIAVVVADTPHDAAHAASLIEVEYEAKAARLDFEAAKADAYPDPDSEDYVRGKPEAALAASSVRMSARYTTPLEFHNAMEPHTTTAVWNEDTLTVYDSTQFIFGVRKVLAKTFGIDEGHVRVVSTNTGGGFGGKGSVWSHVVLAAMAAREVAAPVRLALERPQLFGPVGGRPRTEQHLAIGASEDGRLSAITHEFYTDTSEIEDWGEDCGSSARMLYLCDNVRASARLVKMNLGTPTFQRAPGHTPGSFAVESAIDELACRLGIDPVELRLKNHADKDPEKDLPFSSKSLRECYAAASTRFGWAKRNPAPRSMRAGDALIGYGMATATYPVHRMRAAASVEITPAGIALVRAGTQEIGTGTVAVMTQIAADALGIDPDRVRFELGDTDYPRAPITAGSMTVASLGPAVHAACELLRGQIDKRKPKDEPLLDFVARHPNEPFRAGAETKQGKEKDAYSMHAFGAVFAEVRIDADLCEVRVPRIVGAYGCGRIINPKTARNQIAGGIVWGIGMALHEHGLLDERYGRIVNANLSEYHVPVNADVGEIDVIFVDEDDPHVNPLGAKGIGEIGITGVAAAIANAVYHATGKRIRDLPITVEKLL
ncbi:MAG TPA: xanthine dehydrogenase family protein molybdopterin-binding subunit [Burkholderiales bacterium]|nr:xanthine dehydrogenase family protein molybdopterin-binding subunit [Burkholderiales bacterium]